MSDSLTRVTAPQQFDAMTTPKIMWGVSAALLPALGWGVYQFGAPALGVLATALVVALLGELLFSTILDRGSLSDGNAVMIGLLLSATMPPATPLYMVGAATLFAMVVIKWTFGGTGSYWINPVAGGYVFAVVSFPSFGSHWIVPRSLGGPAGDAASPLNLLAGAGVEAPARLAEAYHRLAGLGTTSLDDQVTRLINNLGGEFLGVRMPGGYTDLFLGNAAGTVGGASVALLLLGSIFLLGCTILPAVMPFLFLGSFSLLIGLFGGVPYGAELFAGDVLFHLTTGATVLGAFFVATETVTSPLTGKGMAVYAVLAGALAGLFRLYGSGVHGVMVGILLSNTFVPLIDRYTMPRRYGVRRNG
ncbi:MAG: RnfABCDGE type electron transport complex subunit D [Spirochaetaceae bacterium]